MSELSSLVNLSYNLRKDKDKISFLQCKNGSLLPPDAIIFRMNINKFYSWIQSASSLCISKRIGCQVLILILEAFQIYSRVPNIRPPDC